MQCTHAEKLIIEASQTELDPKVKADLENHIMTCPKCTNFSKNLIKMREGIRAIKSPALSGQVLENTRALCRNELTRQSQIAVIEIVQPHVIRIPKFVWIAFAFLIILTIAWAVPVIREFIKSQIVTQQAILIIVIIVQNLFVLLLSPVLLRKLKARSFQINYQF